MPNMKGSQDGHLRPGLPPAQVFFLFALQIVALPGVILVTAPLQEAAKQKDLAL